MESSNTVSRQFSRQSTRELMRTASQKLARKGTESLMLAHQASKPVVTVGVLVCGMVGATTFGTSQVVNVFASELSPSASMSNLPLMVAMVVSAIGCALFFPMIGLEMYWYRNESGKTWYERYKDTPGVMLFQLVCSISFWGFLVHTIMLIKENTCHFCSPERTFSSWVMANYYRQAYWSHIFASLFISALGPFQFIEKVRKYHGFVIHRWFGRMLLSTAVIHQASATVMFVSALLSKDLGPQEVEGERFWHYAYCGGFALWNVYSWVAIILGWRAILQRKIASHGAWMHRLGALWFGNVVAFRILPMFVVILIPNVAKMMVVCVYLVFTVSVGPTEWYVQKSGRFPVVPAVEEANCPFLAAQK